MKLRYNFINAKITPYKKEIKPKSQPNTPFIRAVINIILCSSAKYCMYPTYVDRTMILV